MTEEIEARNAIQSCEVALNSHVEKMLRQVFADPDVRGVLDQIGGWDVRPFLRRCLIAEIEQQLQPTPRWALEILASVDGRYEQDNT
jgi:hypothetical protein